MLSQTLQFYLFLICMIHISDLLQFFRIVFLELPAPRINKTKEKENKEKNLTHRRMKTRSQTKKEESSLLEPTLIYECVDEFMDTIDFDEASKAWRSNKIKLKNGCFRYKKERVSRMKSNQ